jgi:hypothetical protein
LIDAVLVSIVAESKQNRQVLAGGTRILRVYFTGGTPVPPIAQANVDIAWSVDPGPIE